METRGTRPSPHKPKEKAPGPGLQGEVRQHGTEEQWPPQAGDQVKSRNGQFRFPKKTADSSLGH